MSIPNQRSQVDHPASTEADGERQQSGVQWTTNDAGEHAAPSPAAPEWLGRELDGRYRILAPLGHSRMGAMFLALHLPLQKLVAIKVVPAELIGNGEAAIRQTRAVIANPRFEHPHVVRANDCATLPEGGAYFVMQLVQGRGLSGLLARGEPLPWAAACELGVQIADALSAAELAQVVHRDLNPDNILLESREDGSEFVKILDFGIAQALPADAVAARAQHSEQPTSWSRTVIGTPGYMAPEQAIGATPDHRCDLYALGVVLWECIAGRALFTGADVASLLLQQMCEAAPSLHQAAPDATRPPELDRLIERLLDRNPAARPARAAEVCEMLRCLADDAAFPLSDDPAWQSKAARLIGTPRRWLGPFALASAAVLCWGAYRWSTSGRAVGSMRRPASAMASVQSSVLAPGAMSAPELAMSFAKAETAQTSRSLSNEFSPEMLVSSSARSVAPQRPSEPRTAAPQMVRKPSAGASAIPQSTSESHQPSRRAERIEPIAVAEVPLVDSAPPNSETRPVQAKSKPSAQLRDLDVRGSVTTSEVRRALDRVHARLAGCHVPNASAGSESTELAVEVSFDERGRARDPQVQGTSAPELKTCVIETLGGLVLTRAPDTGLARAAFRITFSTE